MATALTVYPNKTSASVVVSTANQLIGNATISTSGGTQGNTVGTATGYGEITSKGTGAAWAAGSVNTAIAPTGKGWFLDSSILDLQDIIAGNWTAIWLGTLNANTATVDLYTRFYLYVSGVYTQIGYILQSGTMWTNVAATYTSADTSMPASSFPTGSHLYIDLWGNITATTMVAGNSIAIRQSNIASNGQVACNVITPGYAPTTVALAVALSGVGTLSGTLSANTALVGEWDGVGTLAAADPTLSTALSGTLAGVGTLAGTLSASTALTGTLVGIGTLSGTATYATWLSSTLTGVGTLSGAFSLACALSLTCAGMGTLVGTLSIPGAARYLTATWVTRDMQATWKTRDENAAWNTRDEQDSWKTRG